MSGQSDLDRQIEQLKNCELIKEAEVKQLCQKAKEILVEEANVQRVFAPVTVCSSSPSSHSHPLFPKKTMEKAFKSFFQPPKKISIFFSHAHKQQNSPPKYSHTQQPNNQTNNQTNKNFHINIDLW